MLTAQDLRLGTVVFWHEGGWTTRIEDALVARDAAGAAMLEAAHRAAAAGDVVVEAYLQPTRDAAGTVPARLRDRARVAAPDRREGSHHVPL